MPRGVLMENTWAGLGGVELPPAGSSRSSSKATATEGKRSKSRGAAGWRERAGVVSLSKLRRLGTHLVRRGKNGREILLPVKLLVHAVYLALLSFARKPTA